MGTRWHYSGQQKTDEPVDTPELLRLAAEGLIKPADLVRRSGSKRWTRAARIEGLFYSPEPEWYYIHDGQRVGPVTLGRLRRRTRRGQIRPDDLVWKPGLRNWKRAAQIVGPCPSRSSSSTRTEGASAHRAPDRPGGESSGPRKERGRPRSASRLWLLASVCPVVLAIWIGREVRKSEPTLEPASAPIGTTAGAIGPGDQRSPGLAIASAVAPKHSDPSRQQDRESRVETRTVPPSLGRAPTSSSPPASGEAVAPRPEQEPDLGRAVHELILARHSVLNDSALLGRLRGVAASLAGRASESDLDLRFAILDSEGVFAFSHPGGYLYFSRGLFNFVRDDVELQFVVGRELALLEARYLERRAGGQAPETVARPEAQIDLARRLYHQIAVGYADDQVFDADARAYLVLRRLGHPAYKVVSFLRRYINYASDYEPGPARRRPSTSVLDDRQEIENHWRSQPPARMRYERLCTLDVSSDQGSPDSSATAP